MKTVKQFVELHNAHMHMMAFGGGIKLLNDSRGKSNQIKYYFERQLQSVKWQLL